MAGHGSAARGEELHGTGQRVGAGFTLALAAFEKNLKRYGVKVSLGH